jgi:hypothetical protein
MLDQPKGHARPRGEHRLPQARRRGTPGATTLVSASALRIGFATARHVGGERVSFYMLGELIKMM